MTYSAMTEASVANLDIKTYIEQKSKFLFYVVLIVFTVQIIALNFLLDKNILPDEIKHELRVEYYITHSVPMLSQPLETADLGQLSHSPFFYYYVLSKVIHPIYNLASSDWLPFFILRFLNNILAILSVISIWWLVNCLTNSKLLALTTVFAYSQTTMVFFISSGISYDNAVMLFAFTACALTAELILEWNINKFLLLNVVLQAGSLSKISFLPLYVGCMFILLVIYRYSLVEKVLELYKARRSILILFAVLTLLTAFFYGRNIIEFRSPFPTCDQVLGHEACLSNGVYARNVNLLETDPGVREYNVITYFPQWVRLMSQSLYSFMGHKRLTEEPINDKLATVILGYLIISTGMTIIFGSKKQRSMAFIAVFYTLFLCYYFNYYSLYLDYGRVTLAVQGRYLMPVLPLLYFFAANAIYHLVRQRDWLFFVVIVPGLMLILYYGYMAVLRDVNPDWANDWILPIIKAIV